MQTPNIDVANEPSLWGSDLRKKFFLVWLKLPKCLFLTASFSVKKYCLQTWKSLQTQWVMSNASSAKREKRKKKEKEHRKCHCSGSQNVH
jgi:hypothetical protein